MDIIRSYVENAFAAYASTPQMRDLKEEILANMEEKYEEMKRQGHSENEAVAPLFPSSAISASWSASWASIKAGRALPLLRPSRGSACSPRGRRPTILRRKGKTACSLRWAWPCASCRRRLPF